MTIDEAKAIINKLELSENDVVVFSFPDDWLNSHVTRDRIKMLIKTIERKLPYDNQIVAIPKSVDITILKHKPDRLKEFGIDLDIDI